MRALSLSVLALTVLLILYGLFYNYSCRKVEQMSDNCSYPVMKYVETENWSQAETEFQQIYHQWKEYRRRAFFVLESDSITQIDEGFDKTLMYIKAEDLSNSSGELLALEHALHRLWSKDTVTLQNIL